MAGVSTRPAGVRPTGQGKSTHLLTTVCGLSASLRSPPTQTLPDDDAPVAHAAGQAAVWRLRPTRRMPRKTSQTRKMKGRRLLYELNQDTIYNPSGAATLLFLGTCV